MELWYIGMQVHELFRDLRKLLQHLNMLFYGSVEAFGRYFFCVVLLLVELRNEHVKRQFLGRIDETVVC